MKKFIVITTINHPTEAIRKYAGWNGWDVIVVGDQKTPAGWSCDGVQYLGLEEQAEIFGSLASDFPLNTYTRKNLGYLYAMQQGADYIYESDDDNIPYHGADKVINFDSMESPDPLMDYSIVDLLKSSPATGWINIYREFADGLCWPRGFPLDLIRHYDSIEMTRKMPWGIIQYLVDDDPDTDAIYRLIIGQPVKFCPNRKISLFPGTFCPINSQSTLWKKELFPLMFLPVGVSDRVTDILRGYMAQACLWKSGYCVTYASPLAVQKRNYHDLMTDLRDEWPLYRNASGWCDELINLEATNMMQAFDKAIRWAADAMAIPAINVQLYDNFTERCL
jgi:hypothetical protein